MVIKKIKQVLLGKKNFVVEPSNADKIELARDRAGYALGLFKDINEELVEVNGELITVVETSKGLVEKLTKEIESAEAEIEANNALIERVSQFTK